MTGEKSYIKDYIIAILLVVVLGLSAALLYVTFFAEEAEEISAEPQETEAVTGATEGTVHIELTVIDGNPVESQDPELTDNRLFEDFESGRSICFVGDSITRGSVTDYIPWYEPLTPFIQGEVLNFSEGGWTSQWLVDLRDQAPAADVYVIAIGINDILFIDQPLGAASEDEFIDNLEIFEETLRSMNPEATFYYITPWPFLNFPDESYECRDVFVDAMADYCSEAEERILIDPADTIMSVLEESDPSIYMYNDYHPNAPQGVGLYSYAVLRSA